MELNNEVMVMLQAIEKKDKYIAKRIIDKDIRNKDTIYKIYKVLKAPRYLDKEPPRLKLSEGNNGEMDSCYISFIQIYNELQCNSEEPLSIKIKGINSKGLVEFGCEESIYRTFYTLVKLGVTSLENLAQTCNMLGIQILSYGVQKKYLDKEIIKALQGGGYYYEQIIRAINTCVYGGDRNVAI